MGLGQGSTTSFPRCLRRTGTRPLGRICNASGPKKRGKGCMDLNEADLSSRWKQGSEKWGEIECGGLGVWAYVCSMRRCCRGCRTLAATACGCRAIRFFKQRGGLQGEHPRRRHEGMQAGRRPHTLAHSIKPQASRGPCRNRASRLGPCSCWRHWPAGRRGHRAGHPAWQTWRP